MYHSRTLIILEGLLVPRTFRQLVEEVGKHPAEDVEPSMTLPTHEIPHEVKKVAASINLTGAKTTLVGGATRDLLRKHFGHANDAPKDFDMEVHGKPSEELGEHLNSIGKTKRVGKEFPVWKTKHGEHDMDISVPRRSTKAEHPDPSMTISEAGARRDFTMNTVSMDPHTGHVYDPHGGIKDIKNRVLRATHHDLFKEDPVRVMRGAQFAARHKLTVHPDTMKTMQETASGLKHAAPERIHTEWEKLIKKGKEPSRGLDVLKKSGALKHVHPQLDDMHEDDFEHTKRAMDHAHGATHEHKHKEAIRYAVLLHKTHVGKSADEVAEHATKHFGVEKSVAAQIGKLVEHAHKVHELHSKQGADSAAHIRQLSHSLGPASIDQLLHVSHAHHRASGSDEEHHAGTWLREQAKKHGVHEGPPANLVTGKHLMAAGVRGGRRMGRAIDHAYQKQLDGHVSTPAEALAAAKAHHAHIEATEGPEPQRGKKGKKKKKPQPQAESYSFHSRLFQNTPTTLAGRLGNLVVNCR